MEYDDSIYISGLPEFVDKSIQRWARQKKEFLELKFERNFNAVTNRSENIKRWKKKEGEGWRSNTWVGFVRVKVWAFYAIFTDTVLKAGKIPFSLEPHPYDEELLDQGAIQERDKRIERMTELIDSQLSQRKADREYMKKWLSGAYYGMAFSKFNIEGVKSKVFKPVQMELGAAAQQMSTEQAAQYTRYELAQEEENVPGHKYVSVWNMVWDLEGDNLQDSHGYAEIIRSSPWDLRQLIKKPGYSKEAIERVIDRNRDTQNSKDSEIKEHPGKAEVVDRKQSINRFEFYMRAPKKLVSEFEKLFNSGKDQIESLRLGITNDLEEEENSGHDVEIMGEIADKEIIRFIINETGRRPHHMWVVEENLDEATGTGIADNMEDVQSALVGMIRAFEDNKKLSANITTAVKARFFNKPDQLNDIIPGKKYDIADSCDDVRKALMPIVYPDVGESLMTGIQLMMSLKDDVSMIPTIMQGFNLEKHAPDTAYEMSKLEANAGKYIGQGIRNNDEQFIEPEIWDLYEYNMLYGEDESCKVNCKISANGFTSFQDKEVRGERMKQALGLFVSSEILFPYVKVRPHLDVIYESMDEDPEKFINTEEEMKAESQSKIEIQAQAEEKAKMETMQMLQMQSQAAVAEKQAELDKKHVNDMESAEQEHQHDLEENEQEHVYTLEENEQNHELGGESKAADFGHDIDMKAADIVATRSKTESQGGSE